MFARFDENPAMTLQDIKETKRYGRTHGWMEACTYNVKTVYPPQSLRGVNMRGSGYPTYPKFLPLTLNFFSKFCSWKRIAEQNNFVLLFFQLQKLEKKYVSK